MPPRISEELCTGCGECVEVCLEDVFFGQQGQSPPRPRYTSECWHCGACVIECPTSAIRLRIPLPMRP